MSTVAREAEQMGGEEETDRPETSTDDQLSGEDTVVNITLGTDHNDPFAYAPRLEIHHPIMSILGAHRGQLGRER